MHEQQNLGGKPAFLRGFFVYRAPLPQFRQAGSRFTDYAPQILAVQRRNFEVFIPPGRVAVLVGGNKYPKIGIIHPAGVGVRKANRAVDEEEDFVLADFDAVIVPIGSVQAETNRARVAQALERAAAAAWTPDQKVDAFPQQRQVFI